jgi:hypothetical protein
MGLYKKISEHVHLPTLVPALAVIAVVSWILSTILGLNFWITWIGLFVVLAIVGLIITSDEE